MANNIKVALVTHAAGAHVGAYLTALAASERCDEVVLVDPDGRWDDDARRVLGDKLKHVARDHKTMMTYFTSASEPTWGVNRRTHESHCFGSR